VTDYVLATEADDVERRRMALLYAYHGGLTIEALELAGGLTRVALPRDRRRGVTSRAGWRIVSPPADQLSLWTSRLTGSPDHSTIAEFRRRHGAAMR
jgi:hypothetical protein